MTDDVPRRARLSRAEAKARTRELLLDAAAQTFARKGFAGASVDEIAERAGFSVGALYSNFSNKEELFLELSARCNRDQLAEAAEAFVKHRDAGVNAGTALARLLTDAAGNDSDFVMLQAEFWLYAARNPQRLETIATRMREPRAALTKLVTATLEHRSMPPDATPPAVSAVVAALFDGLARQRRLDTEQVPDDLFGLALRWLCAGIDADAAQNEPAVAEAQPGPATD